MSPPLSFTLDFNRSAAGLSTGRNPGGWWKALGKNEDFYLVETYKQLQTLVYQYEFDKSHPAVAGACEYLFSRQTEEGDFRGFLGNQYAPYIYRRGDGVF